MITIGTTLSLDELSTDDLTGKYEAKVIDTNEAFIYIDYPVENITRKTVFLPLNISFRVTFLGHDYAVHTFRTTVAEREKLTVPALKLPRPESGTIKKIQRRQYVRVETTVDVAVQTKMYPNRSFSSVTLDISGGGLSLLTTQNILSEEDLVILDIVLPFSSGQIAHVQAEARVMRLSTQHGVSSASMAFNTINDRDRQMIISYGFEKQREARRKELT